MTTLHTLREAAAGIWWMAKCFCGDPAEMAREGFVSRRRYRLMRDWIASLEKLVRRIVYLAALMIDPATLKSIPAVASPSTRIPPVIPARRPCFRLLRCCGRPSSMSVRRPAMIIGGDPFALVDDQPVRINHLGRRFEALRHVIWHTRPHAMRFARLLARLETQKKPLPAIQPWLKPSKFLTSGEFQVDEHLTAIGPLIQERLAVRRPEKDREEPG